MAAADLRPGTAPFLALPRCWWETSKATREAGLASVKLLQPGITVNTSPTQFDAIMERFDGERFNTFGPVLSSTVS